MRLLRGEIAEFGEKGLLRETVNFGASQLTYGLCKNDGATELSAQFSDGEIIVSVPTATAFEWTSTDEVSLTGEQSTGNGKRLKILVEKDFICLDRIDDEDNKDAYPNTSHRC